jgi:hypothetical protein
MNWSEKFNSLSPEIRTIGCAAEAQLRIQHLKFEKDRLIKRHKKSLDEINIHIKDCERRLQELEKELIPTSSNN